MYKFFLICFLLVSCTLFKEDKSRERIICEIILNNVDTIDYLIYDNDIFLVDSNYQEKKLIRFKPDIKNKTYSFLLEENYTLERVQYKKYKEIIYTLKQKSDTVDVVSFLFNKIESKYKIVKIEKNPPEYYMHRRPKVEQYYYLAPPIH